MKQQKHAFTLIELIIGISISMILMVSIGVFITSGMKHITLQKSILDANNDVSVFQSGLDEIFDAENMVFATGSASGFLLQADGVYGKGDFVAFAPMTQTGFCLSDPEKTTSHLAISQFFPFEGKDTDLFAPGGVIQNFGSEIDFGLNKHRAGFIADVSGNYFTDSKNHQVYRIQDQAKKEVFGEGVFGNDMRSLNTPTGITSGNSVYYVSDTGNNRILEFDVNFAYPKILLDEKTLSKPTGLYLTGNTLYIVESEKGQILKYLSNALIVPPTLKVDFVADSTQTLTGMTLIVRSHTGAQIALTQTGILSYGGTGTLIGGQVQYEFSSRDYAQGNNYNFEISGLAGDFSATGSYIAEITLGAQKIFTPFFTNGEKELTLFATGLTFPTGIYGSGSDIVVNDFLTRQKVIFNSGGTKVGSEDMGQFDFSKIIKNPSITEISDFVIEPSTFSYKLTGNTLNMSFDYYSFYDCENEKNNVKKSMIIKKELK